MSTLKKVMLGDDPWSNDLKKRVMDSAHFRTVMLWINKGTDIPLEETPYKEFMDKVISDKLWGDIINDNNDAVNQYHRFINLYKAYPKWDILDNSVRVINGVNYWFGGIMVNVDDDGSMWVQDGNHRIAILLALNKPIEIFLCDRSPGWKLIIDNLNKLYPSGLYQSIPHPEFCDWKNYDNKIKEDAVHKIFVNYGIKTVLELGSCHGRILYVTKNVITSAVGIEQDITRYSVTNILYNLIGFSSWHGDMFDFLKNNKNSWDCCLALAVFHHFSRHNSFDKFMDMISLIKKYTKILVYELPEKNEEQYKWIYENIDMHDILHSLYKKSEEYKISHRKIVVLTD